MNMVFHGIDDAKIYVGDSLRPSNLVEGKNLKRFDRVVANLPTNGIQTTILAESGVELFEKDLYSPWANVKVGSNVLIAFLDLLVNMTMPVDGRLVVVVPETCLAKTKDEWMFRRLLVKENILDAVISLPKKKVADRSSAILVIDRSRESGGKNSGNSDVMFIDANEYLKVDNEASMEEANPWKPLLSDLHKRLSKAEFSYSSSVDEIELNNFNLTVSSYVRPAKSHLQKLIEEDQISIDRLKKKLAVLDTKIADNLRLLMSSDNEQ